MREPQVEVPTGGIGESEAHWGLGWSVYTWSGRTVVGHDGASGTANSACAASGLNDFANGQTDSQVQTAADSWKYYGEPKGSVGTDCRGGTGYK